VRMLFSAVTVLLSACSEESSGFYTCPMTGIERAKAEGIDEPWTLHSQTHKIEMSVRGTTLSCKYGDLSLTREVNETCIVGAGGGKLSRSSDDITVCTYPENPDRRPRDCFTMCLR
jgi:hypothetical protein